MEADHGVELAYIIFKAAGEVFSMHSSFSSISALTLPVCFFAPFRVLHAVILEYMGETAQAIEYLEFLQDDPPSSEGLGLTHVLGYLALCFENKGSIYLVALAGKGAVVSGDVTVLTCCLQEPTGRCRKHTRQILPRPTQVHCTTSKRR